MCDRKCMRPGRVTNNGFLNFLREFRKKNCNFTSVVQMAKAGAREWRKLSCQEKMKYQNMNQKKRRRHRVSRKSKKCMRAGPVTNNGYLNFLRKYRRTCCGMTPQETIRRGAKRWMAMSEKEKEKYNRMARRAGRSRSRSRRRSC